MKKIKLSIIVPCYKVEKYLSRCLDSLVNQTLKDIEIICVNDGSPDKSLSILKEYKKKYGEKIVIIDKKNEGVWRARYDGVKLAKGEYIGFIDSDDYVSLDYAEKTYNAITNRKADILVFGFDRIDMETGKLYSREMCYSTSKHIDMDKNPEDVIMINGAPWNKIYKSEIFDNLKDISKPPRILEDMMLQALLYLNTKSISFIPDSLVYYMVRTDSAMSTTKKEDIELTRSAMLEVKDIYEKSNRKEKMLPVLDGLAFLHFGISLMFRLSNDKNCNLKKAIKDNNEFLDDNFPNWRKCKFIKLSYMIKRKNFDKLKLWIVNCFYKLHMFTLFLKVYNLMITKLKIDIKW